MKTQTSKVLVVFLLGFLFNSQSAKAQCANPTPTSCNIQFGNGLTCSQSIEISWDYQCSGTSCGGGGPVTVGAGGSINLTCPVSCTGGCGTLTDLCITATAINGCTITPVTCCWSNYDPTTCIAACQLSCPCPPTPPPGSNCCDNGTSLLIFTNLNKTGAN